MKPETAAPSHPILTFIRNHQLAAFVFLAYALSWWAWVWYRLDPENVDAPILPIGPLLAVLIVLSMVGGWPAIKALFGKIAHWRVGWKWYAVVLLLPVALTNFEVPDAGKIVFRFVFIFVWIALGEEPGWRGFALPRLLTGRTALTAALIVGVIHMVWHAPLYGVEYDSSNVLPWAITVICYSIVITWVYVNTGGSVLMPMLMHASNNTIALVWRMFEGGDQLRLWWVWCALWVITTIAVVVLAGPQLMRKR
jgi:uncharacterized protein